MVKLNRKPTAPRGWDPDHYLEQWHKAQTSARQARLAGWEDVERKANNLADALYSLYELTREPAILPEYAYPIIPDTEEYNRLRIHANRHVELALGEKKLILPTYLENAISSEEIGWQESVAEWLRANDDDREEYTYHRLSLSEENNDLSSDSLEFIFFVKDNGQDQYYQKCFIVWDGVLYDPDSSIAECGLLDTSIGWHVCTLNNKSLPNECRADKYNQGYSGNPTKTLEEDLFPRSKPVYHWGYTCFVGRLATFPHPVKMIPQVSFYGA
jgi:hypothetical protein